MNIHPNKSLPSNISWDNSTEHFLQYTGGFIRLQQVINMIITPTLILLGIFGNIINLVVLTRVRFYKSAGLSERGANNGLVALAISDMLFCLAYSPTIFTDHGQVVFLDRTFSLYYQVYGTGLVTSFILSSTWITVTLASIRFVDICYPLSHFKSNNSCKIKIIYCVVSIVAILLNCPTFLQLKITEVPYEQDRTLYLIDIGYLDGVNIFSRIFQWVRCILSIALPSFILMFCNLSLVKQLRTSMRMRQQYRVHGNASSKIQNRVTLLLVIIALGFIILVLPSELMDFFVNFISKDKTRTELFLTIRVIANLLQMMNFSCNFLIYCALNVHFRSVLKDTCCKMFNSLSGNLGRITTTRRAVVTQSLIIGHELHQSNITSQDLPADTNVPLRQL